MGADTCVVRAVANISRLPMAPQWRSRGVGSRCGVGQAESKSRRPNQLPVGVGGVSLAFGELAVRRCEDDRQALGIVGA
jgi:hypothetical protein